MTTDELTKLRIEVAEKMGLEDVQRCTRKGNLDSVGVELRYLESDTGGWKEYAFVPNFPVCHNAAFTLVTTLAKEGWNCTIESHTDGPHYVSFWKDTVIKKDEEHSAHADTLPAAICLAFLKVKQSK